MKRRIKRCLWSVIFMDRISRNRVSWVSSLGTLELRGFADDVVLLASSDCELQHTLGECTADCEAAERRISTSKSKVMVFCRKTVECSLQVGSELLPQVKHFKYLWVLFTIDGKTELAIDRQIDAALEVIWMLYHWVEEEAELECKALNFWVYLCSNLHLRP